MPTLRDVLKEKNSETKFTITLDERERSLDTDFVLGHDATSDEVYRRFESDELPRLLQDVNRKYKEDKAFEKEINEQVTKLTGLEESERLPQAKRMAARSLYEAERKYKLDSRHKERDKHFFNGNSGPDFHRLSDTISRTEASALPLELAEALESASGEENYITVTETNPQGGDINCIF